MADDVFQLKDKIVLLRAWVGQTKGNSPISEHEVARSTGINRSTLVSDIERGRMSADNQERLAKFFGFSTSWPEWRYTGAIPSRLEKGRRDTAQAFYDRYLAHKSKGTHLTIEAGPTTKHVDRRFADFSLSVSASFVPTVAPDKIPLALSLSFDARGWPVLLEDANEVLTVKLTEVDLQLSCDRAAARIRTVPVNCFEGEGNFHAKVDGFPHWWTIEVAPNGDGQFLAGRRLRNEGQDCFCSGVQVGDKIKAAMSARVDNCAVELTGTQFEGLTDAKSRFIKHLIKLDALRGAEAILGEQILTVIETQ